MIESSLFPGNIDSLTNVVKYLFFDITLGGLMGGKRDWHELEADRKTEEWEEAKKVIKEAEHKLDP